MVILAAIIVVGLTSVALTRLWVRQMSLRLEENLEIDTRLVPLRNALTILRDAVMQAHSIAKELETLRQIREEASTVLVEISSTRNQVVDVYNEALADVETHRATLEELVEKLEITHRKLDDTYLRSIVICLMRRIDSETTGERLIEFLEENGFRVNTKLKGLIAEYYQAKTVKEVGNQHHVEGGVNSGYA
jgi:uncharacterized coiled-coil DUF342 family protein